MKSADTMEMATAATPPTHQQPRYQQIPTPPTEAGDVDEYGGPYRIDPVKQPYDEIEFEPFAPCSLVHAQQQLQHQQQYHTPIMLDEYPSLDFSWS